MQYHIARNGQQAGVFSEEEIRQKLQTGEFQPSDLCWTESMSEWQSLGSRILYAAAPSTVVPVNNPYAPPVSQIASRGALVTALDVPLATPWQRLGAAFAEAGIGLLCAIPLGIGIAIMEASEQKAEPPSILAIGLMSVSGLALLGLLIYNLVLLTKKGQSIGKKLLDIRIATVEDNSNPGFVKCILLRGLVNGIIGSIPLLGPVYSLVDICFIFREDRRCIHDLIAGTHVVQGTLPE